MQLNVESTVYYVEKMFVILVTNIRNRKKQDNLADTKVSVRQQCVHEGP